MTVIVRLSYDNCHSCSRTIIVRDPVIITFVLAFLFEAQVLLQDSHTTAPMILVHNPHDYRVGRVQFAYDNRTRTERLSYV